MDTKTIRWNLGIILISIGYWIREKNWTAGVFVLGVAYKLRGNIPQKHWLKLISADMFQNKKQLL